MFTWSVTNERIHGQPPLDVNIKIKNKLINQILKIIFSLLDLYLKMINYILVDLYDNYKL